jgi:RND family efflux transporter MFP subunit
MKLSRNFSPAVCLCAAVLILSACGERGSEQTAEAGHAHASGGGHGSAGEKLTHYTDRTELFVEFTRLVAGESAAFAAHLTRLADFKPVTAGRVTVVLSGGGQPEESMSTQSATQPGIFRPEGTPKIAGERELAIEVATPEFTVRHLLGPVTVHADRKAADAAPAEQDDAGSFSYTKEQQWNVEFATAEVITRPIRAAVAATGMLRARPDGEAFVTSQASGQVQPAGAFPHLGRAVRKGETLAYLLPRLGGDTDIASLQAAARKAKVELDQSARERARMESLFRDEAVAEKRVLAARSAEESARADYEAAQGRLGQYGGGGGGVPIRAPVAGTIADVRITPGAFAQEGQVLFHIADRRVLWLELRVVESEAARIVSPSGAVFHIDGVERGFEIITDKNGRLIAAGAVVDAATRTLPVVFELAQPDAALRIGMAVKAQVFLGPSRQAVAVPTTAVIDENGAATVFMQTAGESFRRRPVRLGARDGDWVEIVDGLEPGQRVVSRGAYLVKLASTATGAIPHGHAH